ncbi:MAG: ATP-binding protein [Nocardioides sp.]|uniref:sensor histidine kinase n=1 Tax=Nocardioides sp. TaxID=35761 RepID=UPI0023A2D7CF|nr:ATP-binding protein [Nocardioides sp.]MDE0778305.1 ATP-binding protein [Nocardioides sp.]
MQETDDVERMWQLTAEHSPVGMTLVSPEGLLLTANRALCTMLRCEEADLRGTDYSLLTHPQDRERHTALFDETIAGGRENYRLTKRCVRLDGSTLWGDLSAATMRTGTGEVRFVIGQLLDVTEQRRHEELLADALDVITRQRRMSQAILDTVDVGLLLIDREGRYEDYNRRHADFLDLAFPDGHRGWSGQPGEVYAADGVSLVGAEQMPETRAARGEEFDDYRLWIGADPSHRRALSISARSVRDDQGAFAGAAMAYSDITDLMRAISTRDAFLASVSHELRTPLASVIGYLELLVDHGGLDAGALQQVAVVRRNATRLRHLVSDLLDSAQHRGGPIVLNRERVDLSEVVGEAVEAALPTARAAGLGLESAIMDAVVAEVDAGRVRQVVDNLLSNSVKYTDPGGQVTLTLTVMDQEAVVSVRDTGIGMSAADLDRLFTTFFRSERARDRHAPGVGLGLGICEAIVVGHGGRIEVASVVDGGTTFTVRLPLGERA